MTLDEARVIFPPMWTVYDRPRDFVDGYVVRLWWGLVPEPTMKTFSTLTEARAHVANEGGCFRIPREAADDPAVLETWL